MVSSRCIFLRPRQACGIHRSALLRSESEFWVRDAWVRDLRIDDTTEGIDAASDTSRITVVDVVFHHTTTITSSAKPPGVDLKVRGGQMLILRCASVGDDLFYVMTGARNQGPNVVLDSLFRGNGRIQPHQRWSTGFLVDNTQVPNGGIDLMDVGVGWGTGHGWTMGWGVVWNSSAFILVIQNPPGAANWSIGTTGKRSRLHPSKIIGVRGRDLGPDDHAALLSRPIIL